MKTTTKKTPRAATAQPEPAPASAASSAPRDLRNLELDVLELGPNYRRKVEPAKDSELAASLREHGILQPVLVRPWKVDHETGVVMSYQVVAGSRRVRLAREVGLTIAPCVVEAMDDRKALELQLTENIQRTDPDPIEEADAFARLHNELGYSIDDLRLRSGKSMTWVRERLALSKLCAEARALYDEGAISASHALELAKLGSAEAQVDVLKTIERDYRSRNGIRGMTVAELRGAVGHCLRVLGDAPWKLDDATLLPEAGACSRCPKRTKSAPELFAELASDADRCTDGACWGQKLAALRERKLNELKRQGYQVLDAAAAKKAIDRHGYAKDGFARLDQPINGSGKSVDESCGDFIPPEQRAVVLLPNGDPVEVVTRDVLAAAAKRARVKLPAERKAPAGKAHDWEAERRELEARRKVAESQRPFAVKAVIDYLLRVAEFATSDRCLSAAVERLALMNLGLYEGKDSYAWHGMSDQQGLCLTALALGLVDEKGLRLDHPHIEPEGTKKARGAAVEKLRAWVLDGVEQPLARARRAVHVWWFSNLSDVLIDACAAGSGRDLFKHLRDGNAVPALYELRDLTQVDVDTYIDAAETAWKATQTQEPEPAKKAAAKKKGGRK